MYMTCLIREKRGVLHKKPPRFLNNWRLTPIEEHCKIRKTLWF